MFSTYFLLSALLAVIILIGVYYKFRSTNHKKREELRESKIKYRTNEEFLNREDNK